LSDNFGTYKSLQEYLDFRFAHCTDVGDAEVQQAKREYRKYYLKEYYKEYQNKKVQISFRIPKKKYQELELLAKETEISATTYIRQFALNPKKQSLVIDIQHVRILLLKSIDVIEEIIQEGSVKSMDEVLAFLEEIESLLK